MKPEFKIISDLINKNSQVLDVGCGDGILMEYLIKEKKVNIFYDHMSNKAYISKI